MAFWAKVPSSLLRMCSSFYIFRRRKKRQSRFYDNDIQNRAFLLNLFLFQVEEKCHVIDVFQDKKEKKLEIFQIGKLGGLENCDNKLFVCL